MNIFYVSSYLEYLLFSGHSKGHGIHSPFIFDVVTRVFRNKNHEDIVFNIEKIRKKMLHDRRSLNILDLGSGGEKNKTSTRKVSEIARYSAVPRKYGLLLANLASEFGKPAIIELGTSLGFSTMYMAAAVPDTPIYTIDGCTECTGVARENFSSARLHKIMTCNGSFAETLSDLKGQGVRPGFVFVDGDHRKEPVLKYFSMLKEMSDEDTVIAFDDINYSSGMSEAWEMIRADKNVSATIDIFRMGLVFFRKGITPNHYKIRY